ncbi:TonB-dependent receptor [Ilyomonas limi]|uniref:TonB-dependent receptor n=1 Tax=Ilyomonas limi TaxID=2575867 RepID=A0A4U3L5H6_9BACT|nr:TonB-dependent receptor [Ilyomonas limi]TKK70192.1 TonB-dependent receptor [Ilyomonas limi]
MKKKVVSISVLILLISKSLLAQKDTTTRTLDSITVSSYLHGTTKQHLPDISGTYIFAGKKSDLLSLDPSKGNMAQNMGRLQFAQIPGLNMWQMDGAGTQLNIGTRGTDAHRDIEMNMRQNGYMTNSDAFGYPENHYTVPLQAVQQVQYVRGSAALQFGPQFGGMMNYVLKEGDTTKSLSIESNQAAGSYNLFNSYNAVGGTVGKLQYYAYYDNRSGNGWRDNARFNYRAYYADLKYHFTKDISLALQFSRMDYVQQIAGGLTDAQFAANPKQSERARNYFQPVINIPALIFNYNISNNTQLQIISHYLFGQRNSVQFINAGNVPDTVNTALNSYNPRQVDRDYYSGFTTEARVRHRYQLAHIKSTLAGGLRYFTEVTKRRQKGVGTTGSDFDLSLTKPYGIDLHFTTNNYAVFAENIFQLTKDFSITPGVRYEMIDTWLTGVINNATDAVNYNGKRRFPLFGAGLQYNVGKMVQLYGNVSQEYRPFLNANVTTADRLDVIDPNLKDSKGYDIDLGYRGVYKNVLSWDVNAFYVFYGNRVGLTSFTSEDSNNHLYTTNIGDGIIKGIESYIELSLLKMTGYAAKENNISIFNSLAYNHARYQHAVINKSGVNTSINGNRIENTPDWIEKAGISLKRKTVNLCIQYSYSSMQYNDALNTVASGNGVTGIIPAYHVWDATFDWVILKNYRLGAGINNFTNEHYFNRRITMYPGPGILPADGRTFYISFGVKW